MYGEEVIKNRLKNGREIGTCKCGGTIKVLYASRYERETICVVCGEVNPKIRMRKGFDENVVKAMKEAYKQLSARGIEVEARPFANVVEWLIGINIPITIWKRDGLKWLTEAGLRIEEGVIKCG